jgi:hypothetical protein
VPVILSLGTAAIITYNLAFINTIEALYATAANATTRTSNIAIFNDCGECILFVFVFVFVFVGFASIANTTAIARDHYRAGGVCSEVLSNIKLSKHGCRHFINTEREPCTPDMLTPAVIVLVIWTRTDLTSRFDRVGVPRR